MFPSKRNLFSSIPCPDLDTCALSPCLFSHSHSARPAPVASTSSSSTLPSALKRPTPDVPTSAEEFDKRRKLARSQSGSASGSGPTLGGGLSSVGGGVGRSAAGAGAVGARASGGAGLSGRMAGIVPSRTTAMSNAGGTTAAGTPRVTHTGSLHTALPTRQKLLDALYNQFVALYASLPTASTLAARDALAQERSIYARTTKSTYRNGVISALAQLKRRPPAASAAEAGTIEQDTERKRRAEEDEKGRLTSERVERYLASRKELEVYGYVVEVPEGVGGERETEEENVRKCDRCGVDYLVHGDLTEADKVACSYHFGRQVMEKIKGVKHRVYSCCPAPGALPCQQGPHVFRDEKFDVLHARIPFATTETVSAGRTDTLDIVALDCEMVYTTSGLTLARLTVLDASGQTILDERVVPQGTVLDLNTRFSGVTPKDVVDAKLDAKSLRSFLGGFVGPRTVIVGHGVENDLKSLRLVHNRVIDTAILYPHPAGPPFRHALRNLTRDYLGKFIQDGDPSLGHSAEDDSKAALELVKWKVRQDAPKG